MYADIEHKLGVKIESKAFFKSGFAGETVSLKFENDSQKYVAKTYAIKNGLQEIQREWVGLNFLYQANYPVPKPVLSNFAHEKPYILMQQIDGDVLWTVYEKASHEVQQDLLTKFMRAFFDLHALDASTLNQPPRIESTLHFIEKEISEIQALAVENNLQKFDGVIGWLRREKETIHPEKLSILHRDYHPWNALVDTSNNVYVIDLVWGIGDYRFDLAWLCALMERTDLDDFSRAALATYQTFQQSEIHNYDYFKALATLRWLVNVSPALKTESAAFFRPLIQKGTKTLHEITQVEVVE